MFFRSMEYGQRKSQERLLSLHRRDKLTRSRAKQGGGYIYALEGQKQGLVSHTVGVNWCRLWWELIGRRNWEKVHSWEYEREYGKLRHDGFVALKNNATGTYRFYFVEYDAGTNPFDKVSKYNQLYSKGGYDGRWWCKLAKGFPGIYVATNRVSHVRGKIEQENSEGLEWIVMDIEQVRNEVMALCLRPLGISSLTEKAILEG